MDSKHQNFAVMRRGLVDEGKAFSRGEVKPLFFSIFILRLKNKKKPSVG